MPQSTAPNGHPPGGGMRAWLAEVLGLVTAGAVALFGALPVLATDADSTPSVPAPAEVHGRGAWQPRGGAAVQRWELDVRRGAGTAIGGRLAIAGSALFSAANVDGSLDGPRINGTVVDDHGSLLATFSGTVSPAGAATGTYLDVSGETGEWATEGTPLQEAIAPVAALAEPPPLSEGSPLRPGYGAPAGSAATVRARVAALAAVPHPRDPRRGTLVVVAEEPDAPPRFDSGAPDPDRLEPPALPPRPALRRSR